MTDLSKEHLGKALDAVRAGDHEEANSVFSTAIKDIARNVLNPPEEPIVDTDITPEVDNTE